MTQHLRFEDEKGASRSKWVAILFVVLLVGWMGSGMLTKSDNGKQEPTRDEMSETRIVTVAVAQSRAETIADIFMAEGQTEPDRDTAIRAETGGTIGEVIVGKGEDVQQGQVLARLNPAQREADLERARTEATRAERDLSNVRTLLERGVATNDRLLQAESAVASARAGLVAAEEAMENLDIKAPFAGRVEALGIQEGEFIGAGAEVGRIVDLDPLTVMVQVPQQSVADLSVGQVAKVSFITGVEREGQVSFIGSSANAQTRTFTAEIQVPNVDGAIPAGLSAQVSIPTGENHAHFLTPAILSLDTDGTLGVKALGDENRVVFYPVEILRAQTDGVWVSGLPDEITVITVGQGFVNDGELVDPKDAALLEEAIKADAADTPDKDDAPAAADLPVEETSSADTKTGSAG